MTRVRLGVIGTGMAWERLHYPAILKLKDRYEITALCNTTKQKALDFAAKISLETSHVYEDYHEMLKNESLDAVVVAVPIPLNFEVARSVILAGVNLIAEKPLAPNMKQAKEFYKLAKKTNVKIIIAENYRYDEVHAKLKYLIDTKKIGDVIYFIKNNVVNLPEEFKNDTFAAKEWRQHPDFKGGAFLDAGVHDLAGIMHVFGKVKKVQGFGKPSHEEVNPFISINVNMEFENKVNGYYVYYPFGKEAQTPPVGWRIFGTEGMIYLEDKECGIINVFKNDGSHERVQFEVEKGYYNEFLNFYNALQGTEQIYVTPEVEFEDVDLVFTIIKAVEQGKVLEL